MAVIGRRLFSKIMLALLELIPDCDMAKLHGGWVIKLGKEIVL